MTIPTLSQLYAHVLSDLQAQYGISISIFGRVFLRALAAVQAAKLKLFYLAIGLIQKNIFIDTADPESRGGTLERFGRVKLGRNPYPAVAGQYAVAVTGISGGLITAKTIFKSDDSSASPGFLFILDTDYSLSGTTGTITLRALQTGVDSKLNIGNTLTSTSPIALVSSSVVVTAISVQPLAAEDLEDYRAKALAAYRLEPQGGAATDYRLWSYDAQGVEQSYPYAKSGFADEINVYVEATIADSTDGKGTPSGSILTAVADVIEFDPDTTKPLTERGRRPLGVFQVHVLAISVLEVDITIPQTGVTFTTAQRTAITDALTRTIAGIRPFVAAADILADKNDILDGNKIGYSISSAVPGATFGSVTFTVASSPTFSYTFIDGNIPHLNSVTFI